MSHKSKSFAIVGSTGYVGKQLINLILAHPYISTLSLYAHNSSGKSLYDIFPELESVTPNQPIHSVSNISSDHDVYFFSLPHGHAMSLIPQIDPEKIIIDLSADFRIKDTHLFQNTYGEIHHAPSLLSQFEYGLADWKKTSSNLIANPGCYPTATLLPLLPLVSILNDSILSVSVTAYSGTSGAGKKPDTNLLLSEMDGNTKAYQVHTHRHEPEILQSLKNYNFNAPFSFTTHLLPVRTGIYCSTSIFLTNALKKESLEELYKSAYENAPFIRIRKSPPELKWVVGTNFCDIHISVRDNSIILISAIDNLIKGAAGQALQNLNQTMGWPETTGFLKTEVTHEIY